jgi:hypothetical protein
MQCLSDYFGCAALLVHQLLETRLVHQAGKQLTYRREALSYAALRTFTLYGHRQMDRADKRVRIPKSLNTGPIRHSKAAEYQPSPSPKTDHAMMAGYQVHLSKPVEAQELIVSISLHAITSQRPRAKKHPPATKPTGATDDWRSPVFIS